MSEHKHEKKDETTHEKNPHKHKSKDTSANKDPSTSQDNNTDDDLVIDLTKLKGWFSGKGKKTASENTHSRSSEPNDDETNHKTTGKKKAISTHLSTTTEFLKRYGTIFLILIPIILTIYIRLQPAALPITDGWATNTVENFYKTQIANSVNQQYPNLPAANKQSLIEAEYGKFLEENRQLINEQIAATSQGFKDRMMYESGDSKYVYLGDIDSYYWLREARKVLVNGTVCDEVDYEKQICWEDTYTRAPIKTPGPLKGTHAKPYTYSILATYHVLKIFNKDMTIMQASFYTPLVYAILSVILAFIIGKMIAGNIAGLFTSIIITVNPVYLSRTLGSDNDPQNMLYPLLVVFFFIMAFETKDLKRRIIFGILTGFSIALYAMAWQGWWYIFDFIVGTLGIYAVFYIVRQLIKRKKTLKQIVMMPETKNIFTSIGAVVLSSAAFITLISGFSTFQNAVLSPFWFMQTKVAALESYWPNVLVTVAEFNPGSLSTIVSQMGGKLLFFLGLMGILFVLVRKEERLDLKQKVLLLFGAFIYMVLVSGFGLSLGPWTYMFLLALPIGIGMLISLTEEKPSDVKMAILLVIWFVATTYAALKGVRFTLLMVAAFGVTFGVTISMVHRILSKWISKELKVNEIITKTVIVVLLLLVLIAPVKAGIYTGKAFIPSVNDAWYDSLTNIRDNSQTDAIINSWWDFGHWFKYIADRRVTLDGSSQGGPPLHWLGKLMVTDDELTSIGILRMLDCGSNDAFDELNGIINDTPLSIDILDHIVTLDRQDAGKYLVKNGLTNKQASNVLQYTHCEPPEDFFITSDDMVGKAGVWAHFGSWDFDRAEMYTKVKGTTAEQGKRILSDTRYNLTSEQVDEYYYNIQTQSDSDWITPWPGYMSGLNDCSNPDMTGTISCNVGLSNGQVIPIAIDLVNMDVTIPAQSGDIHPHSFVYVTENGTDEKVYDDAILQFSVVLIPDGMGYKVLVAHPYLANSMFTRLFYLNGHGLRYYDKFDDRRQVTGGRIIVWKVDWNGTDPNIVYARYTPEEALEVLEADEAELEDPESVMNIETTAETADEISTDEDSTVTEDADEALLTTEETEVGTDET